LASVRSGSWLGLKVSKRSPRLILV